MAISVDPATQGEYLVGTTLAARAQAIVSALTGTVTCKVYDGSDVERAAATFDPPWASALGGTITVGEVGKLIVSSGGIPDSNWYVKISNGTRWIRGTFGLPGDGRDFTWSSQSFETGQEAELGTITLNAATPDSVSAPANTSVPAINGTARVGNVLFVTDGAWSGSPTPTYTYQWARGGADITGAVASTYTLVSADEGAMIGARVTATNSAGSASANAVTVGPVSPQVSTLAFATLPDPISLYQSGTFSLSSYVSGGVPPYTYSYTGTLPTGVSLNTSTGALSATASAALGTSESIQFHVDDSVTAASLPTFGITSAAGGSLLPFTFGHVFKQGDVPAGQYVDSDLADWQAVPTTYWPDGSLRHAIISGRATCSANVLKSIALSVSATNRSGTALTEANLAAAMSTVTLAAGGDSFTLNSLIGTAARHRTVCTGPVMSNWIYRRPIAGSTTLVAWFDVRLYVGGAVEIMPWIENGYLTVANPLNDSRTYTLTIGGVQKFSRTLDIKHHTRVALIDNSASSFKYTSYWTGTDPQIEPKHDIAYLRATKMVLNYTIPPSEATLSNTGEFPQSFTPNWLGTTKAAMASTGYGNHIGPLPNWAAGYVASGGDARAYRAVIANGLAAGSWPMHFRDEATSTQGTTAGVPNEPILYSVYPNVSIDWGGSPTIPPGSGGNNVDGTGAQAAPDRGHQPSLSYLPWLLTGRWFFMDETLFWVTWCYLKESNYSTRGGAKGLWFDGMVRSRAWHARSHAQLLAILPADHPCFNDMKYVWEQNMAELVASYVTGTRDGGAYANNLGVIGLYSGSGASPYGTAGDLWWDAPWMQDIWACALGMAWDMDVPQSSASKTLHQTLKAHAFKHSVGMAGGSGANEHSYRYFGEFETPYGGNSGSLPLETWFADWGASLAARKTYGGGAGSGPLPDLSYAEPASVYYGQNPVTADLWAWHSAVAFHLGALTIAKEHGAAGAAAAYARVTGATNYSTVGFNTYSIWSFTPRSA